MNFLRAVSDTGIGSCLEEFQDLRFSSTDVADNWGNWTIHYYKLSWIFFPLFFCNCLLIACFDFLFFYLLFIYYAPCNTDGMLSLKTTGKCNVLMLVVLWSHWTYIYPHAQSRKEITILVSASTLLLLHWYGT